MTDLEEARQFFIEDQFAAKAAGIIISEVGDHYAKVELTLSPIHYNAVHNVMGGVLFTMADYAFAIASNFRQPPAVTLSSQISFLAGVKGEKLFAEAHLIKDGAGTCFYEVDIYDDLGTKVAKAAITGYKMTK